MGFQKRLILLGIIDILIISLSIVLAYLLRFDFKIRPEAFIFIPYVLLMQTVLVLSSFYWFRIYKRVWQYASIGELISIVKAVLSAEVAFYAVHTIIIHNYQPQLLVPRSIYLLSGIMIIIGIGSSRLIWRMLRDHYLKIQPHHKPALIIGAGDAGVLIARELKHSPDTEFYPVAFIDDSPTKQSLEILGLPVLGTRQDISNVVVNHGIEEIIIAMPSASKEDVADVIKKCQTTKVNIKILPRVSDIVSGKVSLKKIRDVNVEDLLGRDPIEVDLQGIADYVTNQVVLVTGGGGSIGSELCRQIAPFNPSKLILLGHGENSIYDIELELKRKYPLLFIDTIIADVQDRLRLNDIFAELEPNVIFHAAAHKHVPLMERNPIEAVKNNVFGTKNVAELAHQYGASHFVMISTDKAVNPTSVMGTTKRIAEMVVQSINKRSNTKFVAVRFGNVLGSRGSVIPVFKRQIKEGGPVTVTHPEMVRYFMTIPEAVQLVIQAGALADGGEIFILDMGNPVKIVDLARDLIRLSGFEPDKEIEIQFSGMRPGEKLYEEILTDEEGTTATKHDRIFTGKPIDFSVEDLLDKLKELEQLIKNSNNNTSQHVKGIIKEIVPTYKNPNEEKEENKINSTYSIEKELSRQQIKLAKIELASARHNN